MSDRKKLIELLWKAHHNASCVMAYDGDENAALEEEARYLIANGVTVQRHGRWIWDVETHGDPMYCVDEDFGYRCSECRVWADDYGVDGDIYEEPPTHILHYCPKCGAKMDLRGEA